MGAAILRSSHLTLTNYRALIAREMRELVYNFAISSSLIEPNYVRASAVPARLGRYQEATAVITIQSIVLSCHAIEADTEMMFQKHNICLHELKYKWAQWAHLLSVEKCRAIRILTLPYAKFPA